MIMENLFDTVQGLQASIVDADQLENLCKEQRRLTMRRISEWLRGNAEFYAAGYEIQISNQVANLADELAYLAEQEEDNGRRIS